MVTFKQKEFSPKSTKVIFKAKQAGNAVKSALKIAPGKSKTQLARETVKLKNNLKPEAVKGKIIGKVLDASRKVETAVYQPGRTASRAIEFAATKPAAAVTYGAWMGKIPYVPGTTTASIAVEKVAQKIPVYQRVTKKLGNAWRNSQASKRLSSISNYDMNQFISMIPIA